jgi:hypothetical protein
MRVEARKESAFLLDLDGTLIDSVYATHPDEVGVRRAG